LGFFRKGFFNILLWEQNSAPAPVSTGGRRLLLLSQELFEPR
jgi:hypothetical protein